MVLVSLPDKATPVEAVAGEVFAAAQGGGRPAIYVELSTLSPATMAGLAEEAAAVGVTFLDAPVSGNVRARREGTLSVMVGGDAEAFARIRPVLDAFGGNVFLLGPVGAGSVAKISNNLIGLTSMVTAMEGLLLGTACGLDPTLLRDVIMTASGAGPQVLGAAHQQRTRRYRDSVTPQAALRLAVKDLELAVELAAEVGLPVRTAEAAPGPVAARPRPPDWARPRSGPCSTTWRRRSARGADAATAPLVRATQAQPSVAASASSLIPARVAAMFARCSSWRRARMRGSFSGIDVMAGVRPEGPGPSVTLWRRRVRPPWSGSSSKRHWAPGRSTSLTFQAKTRSSLAGHHGRRGLPLPHRRVVVRADEAGAEGRAVAALRPHRAPELRAEAPGKVDVGDQRPDPGRGGVDVDLHHHARAVRQGRRVGGVGGSRNVWPQLSK